VSLQSTASIRAARMRPDAIAIPGGNTSAVGCALDGGYKLDPDLMELLEDWHHQAPREQPPSSYRGHWTDDGKVYSRFKRELSMSVITVRTPIRYKMLVLHEPKKPDKFVSCVLQNGPRGVYVKAWKGGYEWEPRACAVRIPEKYLHLSRTLSEASFREADLKLPIRKDPMKNNPDLPRNSPEATSDSQDRTAGNQESKGRLQEMNSASQGVIFKLLITESSTSRCLTGKPDDTAHSLHKIFMEFFSLFYSDMTVMVFKFAREGKVEYRYVFDQSEFQLLLKELQQLAGGTRSDELIVEVFGHDKPLTSHEALGLA
jgi:hypothetical protein